MTDGAYHAGAGHLGKRIRPQRAVLFADDNANTEFQLLVWYRDGQASDEGILVLGTKRLPSSGYGSDSTSSNVDWQLFPDDAKAAAALFHVPRQERHPIATLVTGTFAPTQKTYTSGQAVEIVLTLANPATADAVKYTRGGRQRGPRDDQFSFVLTRNGVPLAPIPAFNFGGLSSMPELLPGGQAQISTPLAGWGDVTVRGHYVVDCQWESAFSPANVDPYDDQHRGDIWDKTFSGPVTFDVR